jgi:molybdate transport system substrate-binding protein
LVNDLLMEEGMNSSLLARRGARWPLLVAVLALLGACGAPTAQLPTAAPAPSGAPAPGEASAALAGEIVVFAAASLTDAFNEIGDAFMEANPGTTVSFNYGGSNALAEQIGQGAPADVFASANARQLGVVVDAGGIERGAEQTFVTNRLVVVYPADNPAGIEGLADLTNAGVKLVFAAPEVPVGGYSLEFLGKASAAPEFGETFSETVSANVVSYEENVRAVLTKVELGEADAGIVYSSDAASSGDAVGILDIPDQLNVIASYPIAPLVDSQNPELAQAFVDYVLAPEGQEILAAYGFIPANGTTGGETPGARAQAQPLRSRARDKPEAHHT